MDVPESTETNADKVETPTTGNLEPEDVAAILESNARDAKPWDSTNLSWGRKIHIIVAGFTCTFNGNLGSSMPSGALDAISEQFGVNNKVHLTLLNSLYMVGYVFGPLLFGPLSECIGRRPVLIGSFIGYLIFMLACSAAPSYGALLTFRLLSGLNAAAPTTVISGLYADILDDPSERGCYMALYMTITTVGPLVGPIISGFSSQSSWRWPFWAASMIAAPGLPIVMTIPETFAPVLHNKHVRRQMKKNRGSKRPDVTAELHPFDIRKIFLRPFTLMFTQPIVFFTSLYLTVAYSIFYMMFQGYPLVFQDFYGLSPGMASLAYVPMIVGVIIGLPIFTTFNWWYDRSAMANKKWAQLEIYRRLPLACFASPCMVIALFWMAWTTWEGVNPIIPSLCGLFFGAGYQLVFMAMINYLTDVFRQKSASANAGSSTTRSVGAILLPLATGLMYSNLGIHWAPSLLGFLSLGMGVIPFLFIRYGDRLVRK